MPARINLLGQRFGRLLIIGESNKRNRDGNIYWICQCDCGTIKNISSQSLRRKATTSCTCFWKEKYKKEYGESSFNNIFRVYSNHSKRKMLEFHLSRDIFRQLLQSNCFYCNCPPSNKSIRSNRSHGAYIYNGIDRVDNNLGYTIDNCVPCCSMCNRMKSVFSQKDFLEKVKDIYLHLLQ